MLDIVELKMSIMNQDSMDSKDSQILSLIEALEEKTYKLQEANREVEICHKLMSGNRRDELCLLDYLN